MIYLTIHSYGYSELMIHVLNAIAKFRNSGAFDTIVGFTMLAVGSYYALLMASSTTPDGWKVYFKKMLGMIAFVSILMMPKISMIVKDHVAKRPLKVIDNLPLAFALPVGLMEQWGFVMTKGFEQAFNWTGPKKTNLFSEYGLVFGGRLAKDFSESSMRDPEVVANLHSFVDRCIFTRGSIGYPFTLEEIRESTDLWRLVRSRTKGVVTKWTKYESGTRSLQNCTQGVTYLDAKLKTEGNDLLSRLMKKYHYAPTKKTAFLNDISSVFSGGQRADAAHVITHHLMLNALDDVANQYAGIAYGTARAKTQYEANAFIQGEVTNWNIAGMLALFKVIVYGIFILLVPMMIIGGFWSKWATAAFSLTLWPPLFALLNLVIDFAFDPAQIVSFGALSSAQNKYDSIGAIASTMTAIVPFLAFWVTRMGEGGILHMASPIMSAMSGAAGAAAGEVATNSRSLNNTQMGSESINNTSSNHHNSNFESVAGESSYNLSDGTMMKITGNNQQVISSGDGINQSKFASPITMRDDMQASNATALHNETSNHQSISTSLEKGLSHQEQNIDNYVKGLAKHVDAGGKVNWSALGKNADNVMSAVNHELRSGEGYRNATEEAAHLALKASAGGDIPFTKIGATVEGSLSAGNTSTQDTSFSEDDIKQEHWSKNFESVVEASTNQDFGQSWGADNNLTQDIQSTRASNIDLKEQEQMSQDKIDSLQRRSEEIKSFGSSYDIAATHLVADRLMDNGMTQLQAQRLIDNPFKANAEDRYKLNDARGAVRDELMDKISPVTTSNKAADFANLKVQHGNNMGELAERGRNQVETSANAGVNQVRSTAAFDGVSPENVNKQIDKIKHQNTDTFDSIQKDNRERAQKQATLNQERFKQAEEKAKNAQPVQRGKNALNYVSDGVGNAFEKAGKAVEKVGKKFVPPRDR